MLAQITLRTASTRGGETIIDPSTLSAESTKSRAITHRVPTSLPTRDSNRQPTGVPFPQAACDLPVADERALRQESLAIAYAGPKETIPDWAPQEAEKLLQDRP